MDTPENIRQLLMDNDAQTLEMRAERMAEVADISYENVYTPTLEYLRELDKLYVNGHFMATVVFASTILEYLLRSKLYLVADINRVDKSGLGTLCTIARRAKILSKVQVEQVRLVNKMRNTIVHVDVDFAKWLIGEADPDIDDPYIQMVRFFGDSQLSLMANTCANIARDFAISYANK
jgi:hypothetical protein